MLRGKFLIAFAAAVLFLGACSSNEAPKTETPSVETPTETPSTEETTPEVAEGFTGVAKLERLYDATGKKSDVIVTEITFENGQPVDLNIDVIMNGESKRAVVERGDYVMKEGEEFNWAQQMDMLQEFIVANDFNTEAVTITTEAGNTDAVTGVSIKVAAYLTGVAELISNVEAGNVEQTGYTGVKHAEATVEGKTDVIMVDVVFDNGTPVNLKIDTKMDAGMKRDLVEAGEYDMKNEGGTWTEQIEALQAFIVENNFDLEKVVLTTDAGNTDSVAGVSIKVGGYLPVIQDALDQVK